MLLHQATASSGETATFSLVRKMARGRLGASGASAAPHAAKVRSDERGPAWGGYTGAGSAPVGGGSPLSAKSLLVQVRMKSANPRTRILLTKVWGTAVS